MLLDGHGNRLTCVVVNVLNGCNLKCPQCIVSVANLPSHCMDLATFRMIIHECIAEEVHTLRFLGPSEPTLHPQFAQLLALCHKHKSIRTHMFTNGTNLDIPHVEEAMGRYFPSVCEVGIDAYSSDLYWRIRGGSPELFEQVKSNVRKLAVELTRRRAKFAQRAYERGVLRVSFVSHPESLHEVQPFKDYWSPIVDEVRFRGSHNFSGQVTNLPSQRGVPCRHSRCAFIRSRLFVDCDSAIHLCNLDFANMFHLDRVNDRHSIRKAWNSKVRIELLNRELQSGVLSPQCDACSKCADLS
jgi:MoaA/NifB/PqqE/SkfB family radical SAM enzyme